MIPSRKLVSSAVPEVKRVRRRSAACRADAALHYGELVKLEPGVYPPFSLRMLRTRSIRRHEGSMRYIPPFDAIKEQLSLATIRG